MKPLRWHRLRELLLLGLAAAVSTPLISAVFPANNIVFQTSGRERPPTVGDWYTSTGTGSTDRIHRFIVEITPTQLAANSGAVPITISDAESTAGAGPTDEVIAPSDPTRFRLLTASGALLQTQTVPSGSANGTTVMFSVTAAGSYQVTSETGAFPISGVTTANLNDDDNAFRITVPNSGGTTGGGIGVLQSSLQQDTGGTLNVGLFFLVPPGTTSLALRNFDLDSCAGCTVSYTRPGGGTLGGTVSGNGLWNNGGTINTGQDTVTGLSTSTASSVDAGVWRYNLNNYNASNQHVFEVNNNLGQRLVAFDVEPLRAGLFTLTPSGTLATTVGVAVNHPFTVTNQFYTNDIINFRLTGTSANYSVQLQSAGGVALADTDGDGFPDTGLLTSQQVASLVLRVTPLTGAAGSDTTRISAVSFMDRQVVPSSNTTLFIDRTTVLPPSIAKAFSPNPIGVNGQSVLSFTLSNINAVATAGAAFTDTYPAGLVNAATPQVSNSCGGTVTGAAAGGNSIGLTGGSIPAGGNCVLSVRVTAGTAGNYANTSSTISSSSQGTGNTANATLQVQAVTPPSVSKSFSANPIAVNGSTVLTLTLTNPSVVNALQGLAINDSYPAGLVNGATPAAATTCAGATLTGGAAGGSSIGITGGSLPASSSCTVSVTVTSASAGSYLNATGTVTSTNAGNGNTASATLVVQARPTVAKSFSPNPINVGSPSLLTLTLSNPNTTPMTAATFTDSYPSGLVNTSMPEASSTCGGSLTAVAGGSSLALSGGTIPANGSCTVAVNVTRNAAGSSVNTLPAGGLTTAGGITNAAAASATLTAQAIVAPTLAKSFSVSPIQIGGRSQLRLTVSNTNPTAALNDVAFNDVFPIGLTADNPAAPALSCTAGSGGNLTGGANGSGSVGLSEGGLLPGGSCLLTINVTSALVGTYTNTTTTVTSSNGGTGAAASATLVVQAGAVPLRLAKTFTAASVGVGSVSTLTLTVTNPNATNAAGIAFTDVFPPNTPSSGPGALRIATTPALTNSCGGTVQDSGGGALTAGDVGIRLTGGTLVAEGTCALTVSVVADTEGSYNNTTSTITATNLTAGPAASATLLVSRPSIEKSFSPDTIAGGGISTLSIVLSNPSAVAFTGSTFTDSFPPLAPSSGPGAMTVANPAAISNTCSSTALQDSNGGALAPGASGIRLVDGTIPANGSCTITLAVTATTSGSYVNRIAAGTLTTSGGSNAAAATAALTVLIAPAITKSFLPASIAPDGRSTLSIVLTNSNSAAVTSAAFTDTLPAPLSIAGTPTTSCVGGMVTASTNSVSLAGGSIPGGSVSSPGSCTVSVAVTGSSGGSYLNTIPVGGLSSSAGRNATAATATLTVQLQTLLTVTKSLAVLSDPVNGSTAPKAIPGATAIYSIGVTNSGAGTVDSNTTLITDQIPANTMLFVGDVDGAGSGPIAFVQGSPSSGLSYSFTALASSADDVAFSSNGGATYTYVPVPNALGFDPTVTHLQINPKGVFLGTSGGGNPSFLVRFRVGVK